MIEIEIDLPKLNENFNVLSKSVLELLEDCTKTESHTTSITHEITEQRQKMLSMDELMSEINDCMTKLEQGRNNPTSQEPNLAPSYVDVVGTPSSSTNIIQTPSPAERVEKLEYDSN